MGGKNENRVAMVDMTPPMPVIRPSVYLYLSPPTDQVGWSATALSSRHVRRHVVRCEEEGLVASAQREEGAHFYQEERTAKHFMATLIFLSREEKFAKPAIIRSGFRHFAISLKGFAIVPPHYNAILPFNKTKKE